MKIVVLFLFIAFFSLIVGVYNLLRYKSFEGKPCVKGYMLSYKERGRYHVRFPIITYVVDNKEYKIDGKGEYVEGKEVDVLYEPTNPKNAVMVGNTGLSYVIFSAVIFLFFLIAFCYIHSVID